MSKDKSFDGANRTGLLEHHQHQEEFSLLLVPLSHCSEYRKIACEKGDSWTGGNEQHCRSWLQKSVRGEHHYAGYQNRTAQTRFFCWMPVCIHPPDVLNVLASSVDDLAYAENMYSIYSKTSIIYRSDLIFNSKPEPNVRMTLQKTA